MFKLRKACSFALVLMPGRKQTNSNGRNRSSNKSPLGNEGSTQENGIISEPPVNMEIRKAKICVCCAGEMLAHAKEPAEKMHQT